MIEDTNSLPVLTEGQRTSELLKLGGTMVKNGCSYDEITETLCKTNLERCKPPLDPQDVNRIVGQVTRYIADV